jgi:hypothetical protein
LVSRLKKGGYPTHVIINKEGKMSFTDGSIRINTKENVSREEMDKQLFDANYNRLSAFINSGTK